MRTATRQSESLRAAIASHRRALEEILGRYGATNARLFGSVARGDATPESDIDLLVDLTPGGGNELLRVSGIAEELTELLTRCLKRGDRVLVGVDFPLGFPPTSWAPSSAVWSTRRTCTPTSSGRWPTTLCCATSPSSARLFGHCPMRHGPPCRMCRGPQSQVCATSSCTSTSA